MVLIINSNSLTRPLESSMISILLSSPDLFFMFYYLLYANLTLTTEQSLWTVNLAFGLCTSCPLVWNHHHVPSLPELLRGYLQLKLPPTLSGFPGYLFAELLYEVKCSESSSIMSDSLWPHGLYSPWKFSRPQYWRSSLSPGDLPNPGIKCSSPALKADSLPAKPPEKLYKLM